MSPPRGAGAPVQGRQRARAHFRAARGTAGPRSGRRLPSRSPSASPPGQAPTPEGGTGPRGGRELRATCCPHGPSPPGSTKRRLPRYVICHRGNTGQTHDSTVLSCPLYPFQELHSLTKPDHKCSKYTPKSKRTPDTHPGLQHATSQSSDSLVSSIPHVPAGTRLGHAEPHREKPSQRPGPRLLLHLGHEPAAQRLITQHRPRRAQSSQAETQTLCGEENRFRKLKAIVHILRGLREENHPQEQDATRKELSENKYSLKSKPEQE